MSDDPNFLNAQKYAVEYMREYANKIKACPSVMEYTDLVVSIMIFHKLVKIQFKDLYEIDAEDPEDMLNMLEKVADEIAKRVANTFQESRKKEAN